MTSPQIAARERLAALLLAGTLAACAETPAPPPADAPEPGVLEATSTGPADAPPGTCWGRTVSPAVVERVTERVEVIPARVNPDGTIAEPPVYRREERQVIVTPRRSNWFETPCREVQTPDFIASLQRALTARGDYGGAINGRLDPSTRAAIQRFQQRSGLDSPVLSLESARALGLVAVSRDSLSQTD